MAESYRHLEKTFRDTIEDFYNLVDEIADRTQPIDPLRAKNVQFIIEHAIAVRGRMELAISEALSAETNNDELLADLKAISVDPTNTAAACDRISALTGRPVQATEVMEWYRERK